MIIPKSIQKEFVVHPQYTGPAVCVDVIDLGELPTAWGPKPKIELRWQLDEINPETQKPFQVRARFTNSLHEKAILRQTLETWRARKFTAEELKGWDLEKLIGVCAQVQIIHAPGDEGRADLADAARALEGRAERLGLKEEIAIMDLVQQLAKPSEAVLQRLHVDTRYVWAKCTASFKGGVVRRSFHFLISEWPSAKEKPQAPP